MTRLIEHLAAYVNRMTRLIEITAAALAVIVAIAIGVGMVVRVIQEFAR